MQIAFFIFKRNHEKYYIKMGNQWQNITEKHWQRQLPLLKCNQTFRDTVTQYPRRKKINLHITGVTGILLRHGVKVVPTLVPTVLPVP